jgi:ubiquinone/menaquinone biosynthesis C-methylase UbiE
MGHTSLVTKSHASRTTANSAAFLLPYLKPHMSLLDVGCGPGTITLGFASYLPQGRIVGVDYSESVIAEARKLGESQGVQNVTFQTGSVFSLPFEENTFDVIYSHQLFPHLSNPVQALTELRRVLRPNGICATRDADTFSWSPSLPGLDLCVVALGRMLKSGGATFPPGREMHRWAREAGFSREKMMISAGATVYSSKEEREWWGGVMMDRFTKDEHYWAKTIESGTNKEEIKIIVRDLKMWIADEDGWYGLLQSENIYRK